MRGVGTLIICFIGIAIVYGVYWAGRATTAAKDAAAYVKETGNVTDALKLVWATQSLPDNMRLSAAQFKFMQQNEMRFQAECELDVSAVTHQIFQRLQQSAEMGQREYPSEAETIRQAMTMATFIVAKQWCLQRGVA